ncbi:hypothetical protein K4K59_002336 [Colletotrichum sp. SAR11_240]|nr:hypothetical protein K4K59_002336 [Colletotrichum sp. SAR11_240]
MTASQPHGEHKRDIVENEHGDHAVHVEGDDYNETMKIEEQSAPTWSKEEEGQALRKLDWNLIPLLGALYLVSYIDRGNVGNAYTAGMGEEWGITSEDYSWIVTILYIGYILFHWLILLTRLLVEGSPTILLAIVAYFYLPPSPSECRFLTPRQNEIISHRAFKGRGEKREGKLNFKQAFAASYDYKNYLQALIIFCLNTAFGSLPAYLPTILQAMGYTSLHAQGFSACPYLAAYVVCVTASFVSDRFRTRGVFIVLFCCTGAVGYVLLVTIHTTGVRYFATFLVRAGVFPAVALTFTWVTDNQGSASKRGAGLAIFGMVGQCGPILGARLFPKTDQPWYAKGMWTCAGILFAAAALATVLSLCLRFQNKKRDEKYGKSDLDYVPAEVADKGDDHPMYRYVL